MADNRVAGFAWTAEERFSKLASPAKAMVTGFPLPSGPGAVVVGAVVEALTAVEIEDSSPSAEPFETLPPLVEHADTRHADPNSTKSIDAGREFRTAASVPERTTRFGTLLDCG